MVKRTMKKQSGQAMAEYIVVIASLVMLYNVTPVRDGVVDLENAINNKAKGYSYGISLSDYPDAESLQDLINHYPQLSAQRDKLQAQINQINSISNRMNSMAQTPLQLPSAFSPNGMPNIDLSAILRSFI